MIKATRLAALVIAATAVVASFLLLSRNPRSHDDKLGGVLGSFMECLPSNLTAAHVSEIEDILLRYQASIREGKVRPQDGAELTRQFQHHVDADSISRNDLNLLMAKVSFYMHREDPVYNPPDGSATHPLLEEEKPDSIEAP